MNAASNRRCPPTPGSSGTTHGRRPSRESIKQSSAQPIQKVNFRLPNWYGPSRPELRDITPSSQRSHKSNVQGLTLEIHPMIRKLSSGGYRLYSRKKNPKTGKRRNLGTFKTRAAAEQHEREVQYLKRHG